MESVETTTIYISKEEQSVIEDLIICLNKLSLPLNNDDYVNIFRSIANKDAEADNIEDLLIRYE